MQLSASLSDSFIERHLNGYFNLILTAVTNGNDVGQDSHASKKDIIKFYNLTSYSILTIPYHIKAPIRGHLIGLSTFFFYLFVVQRSNFLIMNQKYALVSKFLKMEPFQEDLIEFRNKSTCFQKSKNSELIHIIFHRKWIFTSWVYFGLYNSLCIGVRKYYHMTYFQNEEITILLLLL